MTADPSTSRTTFVYGSCVSRDTHEFLDPERFTLGHYVARQSLISAFSEVGHPPDVGSLDSPFQRRMLVSDFAGSVPVDLSRLAPSVDLLLWDLTDERLGVMVSPRGEYVTLSVEILQHDLLPVFEEWRHIPFGADEHVALWSAALTQFTDLLGRLDLARKLLVLDIAWARAPRGTRFSHDTYGVEVGHVPRAMDTYRDLIQLALPDRAIRLKRHQVRPDRDHRWGAAPFHYDADTYRKIVQRVQRVQHVQHRLV